MANKFIDICKMSQDDLKKYVYAELKKSHNEVIEDDGYVYAQGKFPVLLVAHLDTVHKELPELIQYDAFKGIYSSPQGIGGDDRCGVYMILEVIKKYNCSVLFCEDEEIGTVGAEKFAKSKTAQSLSFNYIIEFDRANSHDAVFYDCDNPEFEAFITKEFYKTAHGSFSDISVVAPELGCAAVNLSCGYYNAHTKDEYVVEQEMLDSIAAACAILKRTTDEDKFEYIESKYAFKGKFSDWFDDYDVYNEFNLGDDYKPGSVSFYYVEYVDNKNKYQCEEVYGHTKTEAIGAFLMANKHLCYDDILDIYVSLK